MMWSTLEVILISNVIVVALLIIGKDDEYWSEDGDK